MQRNNGDRSALHIHYSPTASDSIGLYTEQNWAEDVLFTGLQYNRLVKRWNGPGSQGVVDNGTGTAAQIGGVEVAGKTGTAETGQDTAPHAWFVSFAPADDPKIAVAVIVENGGSVEHAMNIANHESIRTTKLHDRRSDTPSLEEIERIRI